MEFRVLDLGFRVEGLRDFELLGSRGFGFRECSRVFLALLAAGGRLRDYGTSGPQEPRKLSPKP